MPEGHQTSPPKSSFPLRIGDIDGMPTFSPEDILLTLRLLLRYPSYFIQCFRNVEATLRRGYRVTPPCGRFRQTVITDLPVNNLALRSISVK